MHQSAIRWFCAIGFGLAWTSPALAQQFGVASLTYADGAVTRIHSGAPAATTIGASVMDGDLVATASGRAEVAFGDGTLVHLDSNARVIIRASERVDTLAGRVSLRTAGSRPYTVNTPTGTLFVQPASVVEITTTPEQRDVFVKVFNGSARVESAGSSARVADYHTVRLTGSTPAVNKYSPDLADDFGRWALARTVMATSTPLKGTEGGGGVAYAPGYYYPYSPYPYYYGWYPVYYYGRPYYSTPSYYYPSYSDGSYYSSYYSTPRSYYGGGDYNNSYPRFYSSGERYSWTLPSSPHPRAVAPPPASSVAPPANAFRPLPIPKP
jgi:hypothetical protein